MDYKELIRRLVECDQWDEAIRNDELSLALEDAAAAIETLLTERDEAVEALKMECESCEYQYMPGERPPCNRCINNYGFYKEWQWRGPQKGGHHL